MTVVVFDLLTGDRVTKWITHFATTVLGAGITPEAAELLQRAAGNDLPILAAELDKLASYTNGAEITEAAVTAVVGVRRGETLGDLLDQVAARNAAAALAILPHVLEQPKITPVSMVMALTVQTLALSWGAAVPGRADFFGLLKLARQVYPGRSWSDAVSAWQRATVPSPSTSDAALDALLRADLALKETHISSEEQILTSLILALCGGGAVRSPVPA